MKNVSVSILQSSTPKKRPPKLSRINLLKQHDSVDTKPGVEKNVIKFIFCSSMLLGIEDMGNSIFILQTMKWLNMMNCVFMLPVYTCILCVNTCLTLIVFNKLGI